MLDLCPQLARQSTVQHLHAYVQGNRVAADVGHLKKCATQTFKSVRAIIINVQHQHVLLRHARGAAAADALCSKLRQQPNTLALSNFCVQRHTHGRTIQHDTVPVDHAPQQGQVPQTNTTHTTMSLRKYTAIRDFKAISRQ